MKTIARTLPFGATMLPMLVLAQAGGGAAVDLTFFQNLTTQLYGLVTALIPVVIAIGMLFFIWGLVQYISASGDEAAKEEGKRKMIWGIIALFVIVSVWGLVALLQQLSGVGTGTYVPPQTP